MKTLSFIGSDKNSGKTVAFNFIYNSLLTKKKDNGIICLTSIGINGELLDQYEKTFKPKITLVRGTFFITATEHLKQISGNYKIHHIFNPPNFRKEFILGECLLESDLILEGPNEKDEIIQIKKILSRVFHNCTFLIDGSIDRQFIAHPMISDYFYFSLLLSNRKEQIQKATNLVHPLTFPNCPREIQEAIKNEYKNSNQIKSLIIGKKSKVLYIGTDVPFLDENFKVIFSKNVTSKLFIYLNGALSKSLFAFFAPFPNLNIILDNFTLYHNISTAISNEQQTFRPKFFLFYPVNVRTIFIKQVGIHKLIPIKKNIPVYNLYREDLSEIRI